MPEVTWKVENVSYELGDLAQETYKQSFGGATWFPFAAYNEMGEERGQWEKNVIGSQALMFPENSQLLPDGRWC